MGTVESFEKNNINFYYVSSLTGLNDIINTYGCEFRTRIIIDDFGNISKKYIDLVHRLGQDTGLRFTYDTNVNSIEKTTSDDAHFNVLYGRGASLQTDDDGYSRKISFEEVAWSTPSNPISKPMGQKFIEDSSSISKYGRLEGIYENDKIDDPELLLKKTYEKLQNIKDLNYSYSIDVEDLRHFEGFEHYKYTFGDSIIVLDEEAGITVESRILEINTEVDFIEKTKNISITLGNFRNGLVESEDNIKDVIDSIKDQLGNIEDNEIDDSEFPDTLPDAPNITGKGLFATIMLEWTYENKMYYTYELFASKVKDFAPGPSNRIFEGKASAFLHEVNPEETWYYRARAKNTHGHYTDYSTQLTISTYKISNSENYFEEAAIKDATIGELKLDRGWVGKLIGTYIDAKNLSVTDGNGNQTLLVDSFGRLYGDFTTFKINSKDVATQEWAKQEISPGYILHSINTSIQEEGTSISTISTLLNKNGFSVYNGAINVFNKNNEKVFWVDPTGRASVSNLNVYGEERLGNIDIKGTGNKGIVIRSLDGGDRYIDFSTFNDDGSNWSQEITKGNFTRLWAMNGDFYIMPTDKLFISSCNSKFGGSKLDEVFIKSRKTTIEGNVEVDWLKAISGFSTPTLTTNNIYSGEGWLIFNSKANFKNQVYCEDYLLTKKIGHGSTGGVLNKSEPITFYSPIEMNNCNIGGVGTVSTTNLAANSSQLNYAKINYLNGDLNCNQKQIHNIKYMNGEHLSASKVSCNELSGGSYFKFLSSADFNRNSLDNVYRLSCMELAVSGSKNCVQGTKNYGKRLINAYETCDYYFGDIGESSTENGECIVYLDDIFKEVITTDITYQVFLTKYGKGDIWVSERHEDYFIVQADNDISFGWEIKAKRKGFENYRLEEYVEENEYAQENNTI
jgi:phage minor structural protein